MQFNFAPAGTVWRAQLCEYAYGLPHTTAPLTLPEGKELFGLVQRADGAWLPAFDMATVLDSPPGEVVTGRTLEECLEALDRKFPSLPNTSRVTVARQEQLRWSEVPEPWIFHNARVTSMPAICNPALSGSEVQAVVIAAADGGLRVHGIPPDEVRTQLAEYDVEVYQDREDYLYKLRYVPNLKQVQMRRARRGKIAAASRARKKSARPFLSATEAKTMLRRLSIVQIDGMTWHLDQYDFSTRSGDYCLPAPEALLTKVASALHLHRVMGDRHPCQSDCVQLAVDRVHAMERGGIPEMVEFAKLIRREARRLKLKMPKPPTWPTRGKYAKPGAGIPEPEKPDKATI